MAELKNFEAFGKQLVELGVSSKDLETRINGLNHEIKDTEIKAMVTGFVDALLGHTYHEQESYELVHGFARFLYNGDFKDVRKRVLANFAKQSTGDEDNRLLRWLASDKKDTAALNIIAESVLETNPNLTHLWYKDEKNRPAILKKIVETHRSNEKFKDVVAHCMDDLKDKDGLRALAKDYLKTDIEFARRILNENGTSDDWLFAAKTWAEKNVSTAYHATITACSKYPSLNEGDLKEAQKLRDELKARFIQEMPLQALKVFNDCEKYRRDKEALTLIGKLLLEKKNLEGALTAFSAAEYEGPELNDIGLAMLKKLEKDNKPSEYEYRPFSGVMSSAALPYLENGGDVKIAAQYLHVSDHTKNDNLRRKIGYAYARMTKKKDSSGAENAYMYLMGIEQKTASDERMLDTLRGRMLAGESSWPGSTFIGYKDHKALRLMLEKKKDIETEHLYSIARELNDEPLLEKTRRAIVAAGVSNAQSVFDRAKDDIGIKYVREHIAHGVDLALVDKILPREKPRR